jgi:hypothetical protein
MHSGAAGALTWRPGPQEARAGTISDEELEARLREAAAKQLAAGAAEESQSAKVCCRALGRAGSCHKPLRVSGMRTGLLRSQEEAASTGVLKGP